MTRTGYPSSPGRRAATNRTAGPSTSPPKRKSDSGIRGTPGRSASGAENRSAGCRTSNRKQRSVPSCRESSAASDRRSRADKRASAAASCSAPGSARRPESSRRTRAAVFRDRRHRDRNSPCPSKARREYRPNARGYLREASARRCRSTEALSACARCMRRKSAS